MVTYLVFTDKYKAYGFEKYLKSGSGRAFLKKGSSNMKFYAGGFIYNSKSKEILLHLRDTQTKNNPKSWAFFGGLSKKNETPEGTFKREVFEELNISVDELEYLRDYFNPDFDTHRYVYFVSLEERSNFQLGEGEKAEWFIIDDALKIKLSKRTREDLLYFKKHVLINK